MFCKAWISGNNHCLWWLTSQTRTLTTRLESEDKSPAMNDPPVPDSWEWKNKWKWRKSRKLMFKSLQTGGENICGQVKWISGTKAAWSRVNWSVYSAPDQFLMELYGRDGLTLPYDVWRFPILAWLSNSCKLCSPSRVVFHWELKHFYPQRVPSIHRKQLSLCGVETENVATLRGMNCGRADTKAENATFHWVRVQASGEITQKTKILKKMLNNRFTF